MVELLKKKGEGSSTRSIYKNVDPELVEQIKAIKTPESFNYRFNRDLRVIQNLNEKEALCRDPEGSFVVVPIDEIEKLKQEAKIELINEKFDVCKYFERHHSTGHQTKRGELFRKFRKIDNGTYYLSERYGYYNGYEGYKFETTIDYGVCFVEFNEEGNIESRDYNVTLEETKGDFRTAKDEFMLFIKDIEKTPYSEFLSNGKGDYFVPEKMCFSIWEEIEKHEIDEGEKLFYFNYKLHLKKSPFKSGNRYGLKGYTVKKLKKKGNIGISKSQLIETLWNKFDENVVPVTLS